MTQREDDHDTTVALMLQGDEQAFREVYRALQPALLRYLAALVGPGEAEDVAAETWAQVCRDLGRFHGAADGFRGWVTTIGRNRALDHLRARRRRPISDTPFDELLGLPDSSDTEDLALGLLSTHRALALIGRLPPDQAEAVLLRAVMGLDVRAAAQVLGKRSGAVRTAAHRGLKGLARLLEEGADESPDQSTSPDAVTLTPPTTLER